MICLIVMIVSIIVNVILLCLYFKTKHNNIDLNVDFLKAIEKKVDFYYRNASDEQIENDFQGIQDELQAKSDKHNRSVL